MRESRRVLAGALAAALLVVLSGCSLFGDDEADDADGTHPVTDVQVGWCFEAPTEQKPLVSELTKIDCSQPHGQEAYALPEYVAPEGTPDDVFPGEDVLTDFADGACAKAYADYVGIDYLDSRNFFTYLLPSPRSWEEDDRQVLCLITTTGLALTESVKGTAE